MEKKLDQTSEQVININIGILGHVDSGKTSLVKSLSTLLSTASLDKNPQSRQRGITLDLGFSAFTHPLTDNLKYEAQSLGYPEESMLQFTLVDCPGHASLIRTIIGGAQIIDMMILVMDINKGIQTQTAECLVIGEITTNNLIIVLNKIDTIPEHEKEEKIEKMVNQINKSFKSTKFPNPSIVITSAIIGGEKVAAIDSSKKPNTSAVQVSDSNIKASYQTYGIEDLVNLIISSVRIPHRNIDGKFLFAIDHCFPIKGHGTVLTGTVLSGSVTVNNMIEIPNLQAQRKVKSMQIFRKPVKTAIQGDRVAICVTSIDSNLIERGFACQQGTLTLTSSIICLVKKVRFFKFPCKSGAKYHISVGHDTVIATTYFFGAKELSQKNKSTNSEHLENKNSSVKSDHDQSLSSGEIPFIEFNWDSDFERQSELILKETGFVYGRESLQWAVLKFQNPVYCPSNSLIIGSRLDTDVSEGSQSENVCRIAFSGRMIQHASDDAIDKIRIFTLKSKEGIIYKVTDSKDGICREAIGWKLGDGSAFIDNYIGMKIQSLNDKSIGTIVAPFGSDGKFRIKFVDGARVVVGTKFILQYKKYSDKDLKFSQDGLIFDTGGHCVESCNQAPAIKNSVEDLRTENVIDIEDHAIKSEAIIDINSIKITDAVKKTSEPEKVSIVPMRDSSIKINIRKGKIESIKKVEGNDSELVLIINGAFQMEENIRQYTGCSVIGPHEESGKLLGPFAKLGKCKVTFPSSEFKGVVGEEVCIQLSNGGVDNS